MIKRNSSVESLKIIAVFIIIISHAIPFGTYTNYNNYIDLTLCTNDISRFILSFFRYFGSFGNGIFIVSSCYFLTQMKKVNKNKIIHLILEPTVISILITIFFILVLGIKDAFSMTDVVKMFFPIIFSLYWFVTAYVIVYSISPLLNAAFEKIDKKTFECYLFASFPLLLLCTLKSNILFFNELIGFISLYFIVFYLKKYKDNLMNDKKLNIIIAISSFIMLIGCILIVNTIGLKIPFLSNKLLKMNHFWNPLIIAFTISIFNIFRLREFHNRFINYISSLSLLIYVIHGHLFIVGYTKGQFYDYVINNYHIGNFVLLSIIFGTALFIASLLVSMLVVLFENKILSKIKKDRLPKLPVK